MKIVIMTTFENPWGLEMIRALLSQGMDLKAVICSHDPEIYRKEQEIFRERTIGHYRIPPITEVTVPHLLPFYFVSSHNSLTSEAIILRLKPDLLVLGGADIIMPQILSIPVIGTLNIHPGLLPQYRGCSAVEWALYHDDFVGTTCHFVTPEIDGGPILYSEVLPIKRGDSYESVRARMFSHGAGVLVKGIKLLESGLKGTSAASDKGSYHNVMDNDTLAKVKEKLLKMEYKQYTEE
ncbi:MAG: formyl transferase [Deltaproteobacteria bacterium]|nr:formyl transferase [Deltaproteobacteria bacterium]